MGKELTTKSLFGRKTIQDRFEVLLGKKAPSFISSVLQVTNNNKLLSNADPDTVLNASVTAAVLDLPINQNLGFAWIVPYKGKAQFQMGWKGYVQLALRSGQYEAMNVIEVYENQFKSFNTLTEELEADFTQTGEGKVLGYCAYFRLKNGFSKTSYWTTEKVINHAKKYSQTYGKKNNYGKLIHSPWNDTDQFPSMCMKTVLKNTLSKWGVMSIELQTAILSDQSIQEKEGDYDYMDNQQTIDIDSESENEENTRIESFIRKAESQIQIDEIKNTLDDNQILYFASLIEDRENELILIEKAS